MRQYEDSHSLEESLSYLNTKVRDLGFADYNVFMGEALVAELFSRESKIKEFFTQDLNNSTSFRAQSNSQIYKINAYIKEAQSLSDSLLASLEAFLRQSEEQLRSSNEVLRAFQKVKLISINMAIGAEHYGAEAVSLSTIAQGFQSLSTEIYNQLESLEKGIVPLRDLVRQTKFNMGSVRIQIEMTHFFAEETILQDEIIYDEQEQHFIQNFIELSSLALSYFDLVDKSFRDLAVLLQVFNKESKALESSLGGLRVIRQSGQIEVARVGSDKGSFETHINEMREFIETLVKPLSQLVNVSTLFLAEVKSADKILHNTTENINLALTVCNR